MKCPYYGRHASPNLRVLTPPQPGTNRCALLYEAHAPCRMETAGKEPDFAQCELNGSARAAQVEAFTEVEA